MPQSLGFFSIIGAVKYSPARTYLSCILTISVSSPYLPQNMELYEKNPILWGTSLE
jgi:hypothetical protein